MRVADGRRRSVFELLGQRDVAVEALPTAFPWLRSVPPRVLNQLQTEVRYQGYLPRQQADIRSFQREEAVVLAGTELAKAQVGTIRLRLFKVAARVVVTVRRVVFHLSSSYPYQGLFEEVCARVMGRQPSATPASD